MVKNRLVLFCFLLGMASLSIAQADQLQDINCNAPGFTDGFLHVTSDAIPLTNLQIQCTCSAQPGATFTVPLAKGRQDTSFSMCQLWQAATPLVMANSACSVTANSQGAFFDLANCSLTNTTGNVTYAALNFNALGYHYMYNTPSPHNYVLAMASNLGANSTLYSVALSPVSNPNILPTPCVWTGATSTCDNEWTLAVEPQVIPGNITINGISGLMAHCTSNVSTTIQLNQLKDGSSVFDLQALHDQLAPGNPSAIVTASCLLLDLQDRDYGALQITGLNGARSSSKHTSSALWSAQVAISKQPPAGYTLSNLQVAAGSDSDPTNQYHNLWTVQLQPTTR